MLLKRYGSVQSVTGRYEMLQNVAEALQGVAKTYRTLWSIVGRYGM